MTSISAEVTHRVTRVCIRRSLIWNFFGGWGSHPVWHSYSSPFSFAFVPPLCSPSLLFRPFLSPFLCYFSEGLGEQSHDPSREGSRLSPPENLENCTGYALSFVAFCKLVFTARCYTSAVLAMGLCLSVCVCLSQVGVLLKRLNVGSHKQQHTIPQWL